MRDKVWYTIPISQTATRGIGLRSIAYDMNDDAVLFMNLCIGERLNTTIFNDSGVCRYTYDTGIGISSHHTPFIIGLSKGGKTIGIRYLAVHHLNDIREAKTTDIYKEEEEMVGRRINRKVDEKVSVINRRINAKVDMLLSRLEQKATSKFKAHFGIEFMIHVDNEQQIVQFNAWLQKYDKNFFNHILEPQKMDSDRTVFTNIVSEEFIVKLEKGTYLYVRPDEIYKEYGSGYTPVKRKNGDIYVYIFGKKCMKYGKELNKFLEDYSPSNDTGLLYTVSSRSESNWSCICQDINMRSFDNLFFEAEVETAIKNHLDNWKDNESVYLNRDILFKTGILLYGKAGTGKSSMATAIAKYMHCNIITVDLNTFNTLDISSFVSAINVDKVRYVVLLDEIDTIFTSRENEESTETQTANTMKLLSLLDSPQSPNNVIFVATTNYIDRLDNALTRKGRFDLKLKLGDLTDEPARKMCKSFNLNDKQIELAMSRAVKNDKYNPAVLQDCILNVLGMHKEA